MNILIVESHYRTRSWYQAMQGLGNLFILSTMPEEKDLFIKSGQSEERILDIHHPKIQSGDSTLERLDLRKIELNKGIKFNEIISSDRTLRKKDKDYINKYILFIYRKINMFLSENKIDIVFLEPTWAHDILVERICFSKGIPVLSPRNDRFLKNKFIFFYGCEFNNHFQRIHSHNNELAQETLDHVLGGSKPRYFKKYSARNKFRFNKFIVLFRTMRLSLFGLKNKNIQPSIFSLIKKKIFAILRVYFYSATNFFEKQIDIKGKYVLITLHVQPESSIDVAGARFSNQLEVVRKCVESTPIDYTVVVKEHPHAVGNRDRDFYNTLKALPNVRILDPFSSSKDAIAKSSLVISITGTSCYEAAIRGIPSVCAAEVFFKNILFKRSFDPFNNNVSDLLNEIEKEYTYSIDQIKSEIARIQSNLFIGNVQDCKTDPSVLDESNILNLRKAFFEVIDHFKK